MLLMVRSKGARPTRTRMWVNLPHQPGSLQQKCKCVGGNRMRKTRHSWPQFDMDWCPLKQQQEWWIYNFSPPFHDRSQKRWIMVHQRNQRIHFLSGFFGSLTQNDLKDLGLICLHVAKKHKILFRILLDLRIRPWVFLKETHPKYQPSIDWDVSQGYRSRVLIKSIDWVYWLALDHRYWNMNHQHRFFPDLPSSGRSYYTKYKWIYS